MGKRRRLMALGQSEEERVAARKLDPEGSFKNGSSLQKKIEHLNEQQQKRLRRFSGKIKAGARMP